MSKKLPDAIISKEYSSQTSKLPNPKYDSRQIGNFLKDNKNRSSENLSKQQSSSNISSNYTSNRIIFPKQPRPPSLT